MSMSIGSVSVADDGAVTGSGLAKETFDWIVTYDTELPQFTAAAGDVSASEMQRSAMRIAIRDYKRWIAGLATGVAAAVVPHIQNNATANISTLLGALQQSGGIDTTAPTVDKHLPIT